MNKNDFIRKILHVEWENRASSFESCDCFGLVLLYYKEVLGVDIPVVKGFADNTDFATCYKDGIKSWVKSNSPDLDGLMFTSYKGDSPQHVGICIGGGKVLHARGSIEHGGKVQLHSISTIKQIFGRITFHKLKGE